MIFKTHVFNYNTEGTEFWTSEMFHGELKIAYIKFTFSLSISNEVSFLKYFLPLRWNIPPMVVHPEMIDFRRFV